MWDLFPWPGIKPADLGEWNHSHWTTRDIPGIFYLRCIFLYGRHLLIVKNWLWDSYVSSEYTHRHSQSWISCICTNVQKHILIQKNTHTHSHMYTPHRHNPGSYHYPSNKLVRTLATNPRWLVSSLWPAEATPSQIPTCCCLGEAFDLLTLKCGLQVIQVEPALHLPSTNNSKALCITVTKKPPGPQGLPHALRMVCKGPWFRLNLHKATWERGCCCRTEFLGDLWQNTPAQHISDSCLLICT